MNYEYRDWCKFFADIEENPTAIIKGITIRDRLLAREHLQNCDTCYLRSERVAAKAPLKAGYGLFEVN